MINKLKYIGLFIIFMSTIYEPLTLQSFYEQTESYQEIKNIINYVDNPEPKYVVCSWELNPMIMYYLEQSPNWSNVDYENMFVIVGKGHTLYDVLKKENIEIDITSFEIAERFGLATVYKKVRKI